MIEKAPRCPIFLRKAFWYKFLHLFLSIVFLQFSILSPCGQASDVIVPFMPQPGTMVKVSASFAPAVLAGMTVNPNNPLQFEFLVNRADSSLTSEEKNQEYTKLVKYFLASLTVPDDDQWVNLSPYEQNRIIKENFGKTEMGRDLLEQDYLLKQITSSLLYPESKLGKNFWDKVYEIARQKLGTTDIPVDTINKVWIVPDQAVIYQSGYQALIVKSHLKVMLEEDYVATAQAMASRGAPAVNKTTIATQEIREMIIPEIEKEVNEGKNFAALRQVFSGMILATWYKKSLKESLLGKVYADHSKMQGFVVDEKTNVQVYDQYLEALKKGVYNYIKDDIDQYSDESIPRKYFSGGFRNNLASSLVTQEVSPSDFNTEINASLGLKLFEKVVVSLLIAASLAQGATPPAAYAGELIQQQSSVTTQTEDKLKVLQASRQNTQDRLAAVQARINRFEPEGLGWNPRIDYREQVVNGSPWTALKLSTEGLVGNSSHWSAYLAGRFGSWAGSQYDPYQTTQRSDYTAIDAGISYANEGTDFRMNITGLQGKIETFSKLSGLGFVFYNTNFNKNVAANAGVNISELRGFSLSTQASQAFKITTDFVGELHLGADAWFVNGVKGGPDAFYGFGQGPSANATANWGGSLTYAPGPDRWLSGGHLSLLFSKKYDISHRDYRSVYNSESFGFIPVDNNWGMAYDQSLDSGDSYRVQWINANRQIEIENRISVSYGRGGNHFFSINYNTLRSRFDYAYSTRSAGIGYARLIPFSDMDLTFSVNFGVRQQYAPLISSFMDYGLQTMMQITQRNAQVNLGATRSTQSVSNENIFTNIRGQSSHFGSMNYVAQTLWAYPQVTKMVLEPENLQYSTPSVLAMARVIDHMDTNRDKIRTSADFTKFFAEGLSPYSENLRYQIIAEALTALPSMYFLNLSKNAVREVDDPAQVFTRLWENAQTFRQQDAPDNNVFLNHGSVAQVIASLASQISQINGGRGQFQPLAYNQWDPGQDHIQAQTPSLMLYHPDFGVTFYLASKRYQVMIPTGVHDLGEARRILGAIIGVPQYYYEFVTPQGRHLGYKYTPEGEYMVSNFFPRLQGDTALWASEYYRRTSIAYRYGESTLQIKDPASDVLWSMIQERRQLQEQLDRIDQEMMHYQNGIPFAKASSANNDVGGIDMNSANLDLIIKRDESGVVLPVAQQDLELFNRIEGFVPKILEIKPYAPPTPGPT